MRVAMLAGLLLVAGCHAQTVAGARSTMKSPPREPQVSSARPVRTTPGAMLDPKSVEKIQSALAKRGENVPHNGQLDESTQAALRRFQRREGTAATGFPDYDTLRKLGLDPQDIYLGGVHRREAQRPTHRQ